VTAPRIPFLSLVPGDDAPEVRSAIDRVIASGWFVLGPEVDAFEREFAAASGAAHAVGVGTGITSPLGCITRASATPAEIKMKPTGKTRCLSKLMC